MKVPLIRQWLSADIYIGQESFVIQFNSKTLFKDGDPVSLKLIFPGVIQTCEQYNSF